MTDVDPRRHPAYAQLVMRYRTAMAEWRWAGALALGGMPCRAYCDRFVASGLERDPITWSSDAGWDSDLAAPHHDAAYRDAGGE